MINLTRQTLNAETLVSQVAFGWWTDKQALSDEVDFSAPTLSWILAWVSFALVFLHIQSPSGNGCTRSCPRRALASTALANRTWNTILSIAYTSNSDKFCCVGIPNSSSSSTIQSPQQREWNLFSHPQGWEPLAVSWEHSRGYFSLLETGATFCTSPWHPSLLWNQEPPESQNAVNAQISTHRLFSLFL